MSYCVNCGVELAPSEKTCPLCGAPVANSTAPWKEPKHYPYPKRMQKTFDLIDRRYGVILAALFLMIPVAVSLITDLCVAGRLSWSWYVLGGGICVFCFILLPMLYKKPKIYLTVAVDACALLIYLAIISNLTSWNWYLPLAAPITVISFTCLGVCICIAKNLKPLKAAGIILIVTGMFTVGIEALIDMFVSGGINLFWSYIVFVSLLLAACALLFIDKKQRLKEEIKKRLFM